MIYQKKIDNLFNTSLKDNLIKILEYSNFLASDNVNNINNIIVRQDKNYNFSILYNACNEDVSLLNINEIHKEVIKLEHIMIRITISTDSLNYL